MKPRLLDLFCGAGGCSVGYARAGFEVVGVDIEPQPNYPFEFHQLDALSMRTQRSGECSSGNCWGCVDSDSQRTSPVTGRLQKRWGCCCLCHFAAVHASPPCQEHSTLKARWKDREYPDLIGPTRDMLLDEEPMPYVIENVENARAKLIEPVMICGSSLGLDVRRHRLFETNWPLMVPPCVHGQQQPKFDVYEHGRWFKSSVARVYGHGGGKANQEWPRAMGIDWMSRAELAQAIPPAMTELIGHQLMAHIESERKAAA